MVMPKPTILKMFLELDFEANLIYKQGMSLKGISVDRFVSRHGSKEGKL